MDEPEDARSGTPTIAAAGAPRAGVGPVTIAVVGEVVADAVLPPGAIADGSARLTVHPGGGPANTALTLARLGSTARFAGRLSTGALGALCRAKLQASGVDLTASVSAHEPATLAIATLDESGAAEYDFYTEGTADWAWTDDDLAPLIDGPFDDPAAAPLALHTGSLALALQPSGAVIERLLARARSAMTTSVDPNLRTLLVALDLYRERIDSWAELADILRLSFDDLTALWPSTTPEMAADRLHECGVALVVVSLGADGAFASLRGQRVQVPTAPTVLVDTALVGTALVDTALVDTVGAGDSFHGGLLHHLGAAGHLGGRLESLDAAGLTRALTFASRVAAITCSRPGADPPWHHEL